MAKCELCSIQVTAIVLTRPYGMLCSGERTLLQWCCDDSACIEKCLLFGVINSSCCWYCCWWCLVGVGLMLVVSTFTVVLLCVLVMLFTDYETREKICIHTLKTDTRHICIICWFFVYDCCLLSVLSSQCLLRCASRALRFPRSGLGNETLQHAVRVIELPSPTPPLPLPLTLYKPSWRRVCPCCTVYFRAKGCKGSP